jgi:hypothetical protein
LNVNRFNDVRQIEIHTAEPLVPGPSLLEVEIDVAKLKMYNLSGSGQILAELIQAGGETLWSEIHKLVNSFGNMNELPDQWKESVMVPIYKKGSIKVTVVIIVEQHVLFLILYISALSNSFPFLFCQIIY